jgi:mono/diheme cytochrome c family protein
MWKCICFAVLTAIALWAQEKQVKEVAVQPTPMNSGRIMFKEYCASCHGLDGRGYGPAATALKRPPADLTELTRRHGGKFPGGYVAMTLKNFTQPAHGSGEMPVWGPLLSSVSRDTADLQLRINNVVSYIESIQAK